MPSLFGSEAEFWVLHKDIVLMSGGSTRYSPTTHMAEEFIKTIYMGRIQRSYHFEAQALGLICTIACAFAGFVGWQDPDTPTKIHLQRLDMPAFRTVSNSRRRRSSLGLGLTGVKAGTYGITTSPRNVTFAPNVTPGTYVEDNQDDDAEPPSPSNALFPPAEEPAPAPSRRRQPPGKRRSQGYIPRPPNAFMLFRADFVRQKHVPGSIETNHGSLSKIIGNCWRSLPVEEKKVWEARAKRAKAEHKERYPNYRFRPVHNKHKKAGEAAKRKEKTPIPLDEERRCEEVAQLLLEGKKGEELAAAVRMLDIDRSREMTPTSYESPMLHMPAPLPSAHAMSFYTQRRPSSVPPPTTLYHPISVPTVPFLMQQNMASMSRPDSPINNIARSNRMFLGQRRASSADPLRSWTMPSSWTQPELQQDHEPLPDFDRSLFQESYLDSASPFTHQSHEGLFLQTYQQPQVPHPDLALSISPLDNVCSPGELTGASTAQSSAYPFFTPDSNNAQFEQNMSSWGVPPSLDASSGPSSTFSGSPSPSESTLVSQSQHTFDYEHPHSQAHQPEVVAPMPNAATQMHQDMSLNLQDYGYDIDMESYGFPEPPTCGPESSALFDANPFSQPGYLVGEY
ncbi:hypothetical protein K474DRAFT_1677206 [Panus rudis PR-1116 ss-1]|nr:hypothetical protein K474DRAFT_1677206 [Panus rudis PR-1116 ss-1]